MISGVLHNFQENIFDEVFLILPKRALQGCFTGNTAKRVFQENKARQIFGKMNIFYPLRTQRVKNVRFSENLTCFLLEIPVLRFALLLYYRRFFSEIVEG